MATTHKFLRTAAVMLGLTASTGGAQPWDYEVTPYLWMPSFSAGLTLGALPPTEGETSFWDVLEGAFLLQGEARNDDFAVFGEFNYLKLGNTYAPSVPVLQTDVGLDGYMAMLAYARTVTQHSNSRLDVYGGARYWNLTLTARNQLAGGAQSRQVWIDPVIGLRGRHAITETLSVDGDVNIGGFGVGSQFQADVSGSVAWRLGDATKLRLGYRYLKVDFEGQAAVADIKIYGPFVALGFQF